MNSGKSETGPSGESETRELANDAPLAFPEWSGVLAGVDWPEDTKKRRQLAIMRLLKFCKLERRPVSVTLIKSYLDGLLRVTSSPMVFRRPVVLSGAAAERFGGRRS